MVKMILIFALSAANSDLIGFNRLGNNIASKLRQKSVKSKTSLLANFVLEDKRMSVQEKVKLIRLITNQSEASFTRRSTKWNGKNLSPKKQGMQKFRKNLYYKQLRSNYAY